MSRQCRSALLSYRFVQSLIDSIRAWTLSPAFVVLICAPGGLQAQSSLAGAAQRQTAQEIVPPLPLPATLSASSKVSADATGSSGTVRQDEFGVQQVIQRRAHVEPWSASAGADISHTDNAGLTHTNRQGDWYTRYGLTAAYTTRIGGPFFLDLSLQQYFFRYGKFDALDFDLTRLEGTLLANVLPLDDAFIFLRYRLEWLTEAGFGSSLLTEHLVEIGVQKIWKINRRQQLFAGISASIPMATDPSAANRSEYSASLGYTLRLSERITGAISYRGSWFDYRYTARSDWNHIFAAGVTYEIAEWLRLGLNFAYTLNESNEAYADYYTIVPGGSLSLRVTF